MKNIYEMELHDKFMLDDKTQIIRVPGGWIYKSFQADESFLYINYSINSVFVPFNNEFIEIKK